MFIFQTDHFDTNPTHKTPQLKCEDVKNQPNSTKKTQQNSMSQ